MIVDLKMRLSEFEEALEHQREQGALMKAAALAAAATRGGNKVAADATRPDIDPALLTQMTFLQNEVNELQHALKDEQRNFRDQVRSYRGPCHTAARPSLQEPPHCCPAVPVLWPRQCR